MTVRLNWGTGIAVAYTSFALATLGFVAFAMTKDVDLVSPEYYARSLEHDARMAATANSAALGSSLVIDIRPEARAVHAQWPAAMAPGISGTATLYRPSSAALDRTIRLAPDAAGRQVLSLEGLTSGRWRLQLEWTAHGVAYYAERDIVTP
jgi:nitrogen fixation protein FixH